MKNTRRSFIKGTAVKTLSTSVFAGLINTPVSADASTTAGTTQPTTTAPPPPTFTYTGSLDTTQQPYGVGGGYRIFIKRTWSNWTSGKQGQYRFNKAASGQPANWGAWVDDNISTASGTDVALTAFEGMCLSFNPIAANVEFQVKP
jgi:hypothetical protein